jgi:hypothetical protein
LSYSFSVLPEDWKCADVLPIFKKGNPSAVTNYRPISLTNTLCKVMEKLVKDNILTFALGNNLITDGQHGFLPSRSTCTEMLECHSDWCSALDNKCVVDVIMLDFRKAFDVVPHAKLIYKLSNLGICAATLQWLQAFLAGRSQSIKINDQLSNSSLVTSGVVQGSVLGPILFLLYINDLPAVCPDVKFKLFADDAKAYKIIKHAHDRFILQQSLNAVCEWAVKWELPLSLDKCIFLQLGYADIAVTYTLHSHTLSPCNIARDLGVTLQSNLKPGIHCTEIACKANARAQLILKSFLSHDPFNLVKAFVAYVRPMLEFCTQVWSPYFKCDIDILENVQRSFTRKLFKLCHLSPVSYVERLAYLNLQRLELRRIHTDLITMFKLTHNLLPSVVLKNMIGHPVCGSTRGHRYKVFIARTRKLVLSSFFTNRVAPIWNALPDTCFTVDRLNVFKHKLCEIEMQQFCKGRV